MRLLDSDLTEDATLARAVAALSTHPVVAETRAQADACAAEAVAALGTLPPGPVRDSLESFARSLVERAA